jgi:hypothetical protein
MSQPTTMPQRISPTTIAANVSAAAGAENTPNATAATANR